MRYLYTIARYDLLRSLRDRETFLIGLLMPALMMYLLGVSIGGGEPTIYLDVLDSDGSALSTQFIDLLREEVTQTGSDDDQAFELCVYGADSHPDGCALDDVDLDDRADWDAEANSRLEDTRVYGAILIPAGFGAALRDGEQSTVQLRRASDLSAPALANQKLQAAISRMGGSVAVANLVVDVAEQEYGAGAQESGALDREAAFEQVRAQVEDAWAERPVTIDETASDGSRTDIGSGFQQSGPGTAVMFVLIFMLNASSVLVYEREVGTLQRLFTLPVHRAIILAGKILGRYIYGLLMFATLILVGAWMGVDWGGDILGIALIVLAFTLAATALGVALSTLVRTSDQASGISLLLGLTLAPLGGAWWPLEIVPNFMQIIGHMSPVAWAMDAFAELMWYDGGVVDILPMLGVLLAMAAAFLAFGVMMFKYE